MFEYGMCHSVMLYEENYEILFLLFEAYSLKP